MQNLVKVKWEGEFRKRVKALLSDRPPMFSAIDEVAEVIRLQGLQPSLYIACYNYGEQVVNEHTTQVEAGNSGRTDSTQLYIEGNGSLPEGLFYSSIPLGLVLKNALEVYSSENVITSTKINRSVAFHHSPLKIIYEGELIGLFETVGSILNVTITRETEKAPWAVSAGARTVQFSWQMSDEQKLKRAFSKLLNNSTDKHGIDVSNIHRKKSHFELTKDILDIVNTEWSAEIAFFTKDWFSLDIDKCPQDKAENALQKQQRLENELLKTAWTEAQPLLRGTEHQEFSRNFEASFNESPSKKSEVRHYAEMTRELMRIDDGLKPCLIDVRQVIGKGTNSSRHRKLAQLLPFSDVLDFLLHLSKSHEDCSRYLTILLPGYLKDGYEHGLCSWYFDGNPDKSVPSTGVRANFLAHLSLAHGVRASGKPFTTVYHPKFIDPRTYVLMAGQQTVSDENSSNTYNTKLIYRWDKEPFKRNSDKPESKEDWYIGQYHCHLENYSPSKQTLENIDGQIGLSNEDINKVRPSAGFGLRWFIQFRTR